MMDQLYLGLFVLFLVVMFAVIWMKLRAIDKRSRKSRLHTSGRLKDFNTIERSQHRVPPSRVRKDVAADAHRSHEIWKSRRKRATEQKKATPIPAEGVLYASYAGTDSAKSTGPDDQSIGEQEYASIGEYLAKQEKAALEGESESGLSMTAMKYDSQDSAEEEQADQKKSGTED